MTWRIEQADALTLMRELPDRWAQACVTRPPRVGDPDGTLAILAEVRRVLRDDGTLWLFTHQEEPLQNALMQFGFYAHGSPRWAALLAAYGGPQLLVFAKQPSFFCDGHALDRPRPQRLCWVSAQSGARRAQPMPCKRELSFQLTRRCMLAGSSLLACGECGAPYRRTRPGEIAPGIRRPTCPHNNPCGCCLVLDPFYDPAGIPTAEAALCTGRSFLGITNPASTGESR